MSHRPSLAGKLAIGLIRLYQYTLSGLLGAHCRFVPTCSQFAIEAIRECGARRGSWMAFLRILRCHPWQKGGFDPVSAHLKPERHTSDKPHGGQGALCHHETDKQAH
ncbi:MAG: membrane protein insertion efficiency factor YidD [Phycisphaerae bacterium]